MRFKVEGVKPHNYLNNIREIITKTMKMKVVEKKNLTFLGEISLK